MGGLVILFADDFTATITVHCILFPPGIVKRKRVFLDSVHPYFPLSDGSKFKSAFAVSFNPSLAAYLQIKLTQVG